MKWMISTGVGAFLTSPLLFACVATLSDPTPGIAPSYGAGVTNTVTYTITNYLPFKCPVKVSGIYGAIKRTTVANDCGNEMPRGPSTCNIGIAITPKASQIGTSVNQKLKVSYGAAQPLTSTIEFAVTNAFAHVANFSNSTVTVCKVDPDTGLFNTCQDSGVGAIFSNPVDIHVNSFGNNKLAYITRFRGNSITKCTVNPTTGQLSACGDSGAGNQFNNTYGMEFFNTTNNKTYAYVTNGGTNQVLQCLVNRNNGLLGSCVDSGAGAVFPAGPYLNAATYMAFNTTGGKTRVYVTEGGNGLTVVTQCLVDVKTGKFSQCSNFDAGYPAAGIAFAQGSNQSTGYLVDFLQTNLYTCSVDAQNGQLSCTDPVQAGWAQLTSATVGGRSLLYSANGFGATNVSRCLINPQTGALSQCQDSGVGTAPFSAPFSVAIS